MLKPSLNGIWPRFCVQKPLKLWGKRYLNKKVLGIETSCDDTGVAVVDTNSRIIGESLHSQQHLHAQLGGIIPPIARDSHMQNIEKALEEALKKADLRMEQMDTIAVTTKPGLPLSLLVGMNYAKKLSLLYKKPLIPIHHMEAHALTIRLIEKVEFPFLVLLISGGHSLLAIAKDIDNFLLLGKTFDDAPGEALDKVECPLFTELLLEDASRETELLESVIARRLKLNNINGKGSSASNLELMAKKGDPTAFEISEPLLQNKDCNFSFAGVKNSARKTILEQEAKHCCIGDMVLPSVNDICASVQFAVTKHLCRRVQRAMEFCKVNELLSIEKQSLVVSGGVACNKMIRSALHAICEQRGFSFHVPPPSLCTDNGVMIAWNGVEKLLVGRPVIYPDQLHLVDIQGKCSFGEDISGEVAKTNLKISWVSPKLLLGDIT